MKKLLPLLIILLLGHAVHAQQVNVTGFTVKPALPPDIKDWRADAVNAVAQSAITGRAVRGNKMVVQIRQGNGIKCGNTPQTAAILDSFKTKIIRYTDITSVLGNCQLAAGQYTLCIQFFTTDNVASSQQQCREFRVVDGATLGGGRDTSTVKYYGPQPISPVNGKQFKEAELKGVLQFRWTPVVPAVQGVTYQVNIYEVAKGSTPQQAVKGLPIITQDVKGITQLSLPANKLQPNSEAQYAWNVQAINANRQAQGGGNATYGGVSESWEFKVGNLGIARAPFVSASIACHGYYQGNINYGILPVINNTSPDDITSWSVACTQVTFNFGSAGSPANIRAGAPTVNANMIAFTNPISNPLTLTFTFNYFGGGTNIITINVSNNTCCCLPPPTPTVINYNYSPGGSAPVQQLSTTCNGVIHIAQGSNISFPTGLACIGDSCNTTNTDKYSITNLSNGNVIGTFTSAQIAAMPPFMDCDTFEVTIQHKCVSNVAGSQNVVCPNCSFKVIVDCPPPPCTCGNWDALILNQKNYKCNDTIQWKCNSSLKFVTSYKCDSKSVCIAKTSWDIIKSGDVEPTATGSSNNTIQGFFNPVVNGIYTLTLNASCNGIICKKCVYTIVVTDCLSSCIDIKSVDLVKCNGRNGLSGYNYNLKIRINNPGAAVASSLITSSCGTLSGLPTNIPAGTSSYSAVLSTTSTMLTTCCIRYVSGNCRDSVCFNLPKCILPTPCDLQFKNTLKTKYCVGDVITINWSGGDPLSTVTINLIDISNNSIVAVVTTNYNNSGSINYTIPAGFKCDSNRILAFTIIDKQKCTASSSKFIIECCKTDSSCFCRPWKPILINGTKYDCNKTLSWKCNTPINFSNSYECKPNNNSCKAVTSWQIYENGNLLSSGNGLIGSYTPTANGTYVLTLNASCNGVKCPPCETTFKVSNCITTPTPCDLQFKNTLKTKYCVGDVITINWSGGDPLSTVTINLIDISNNSIVAVVTTNYNNSGSINYTIPAGFKCDSNRILAFTIIDKQKCTTSSSKFVIECCKTDSSCFCRPWKPILINGTKYDCNKTLSWKCNTPINFSNSYKCKPNNNSCKPITSWQIHENGNLLSSGNGLIGSYTPTANGTYVLT